MAKLGRHRELMPLSSGFGIGYKLTEGHRMHGNALFDQPVGAETEDPMQRLGGNAILGRGKMPGGGKPDGKRRSGAVKDRSRRAGYTAGASLAPPPTTFHAPRRGASTIWANKALWPANPIEIVEASSIIWKPRHKFCVVAWVVNPGAGRGRSNLRIF